MLWSLFKDHLSPNFKEINKSSFQTKYVDEKIFMCGLNIAPL